MRRARATNRSGAEPGHFDPPPGFLSNRDPPEGACGWIGPRGPDELKPCLLTLFEEPRLRHGGEVNAQAQDAESERALRCVVQRDHERRALDLPVRSAPAVPWSREQWQCHEGASRRNSEFAKDEDEARRHELGVFLHVLNANERCGAGVSRTVDRSDGYAPGHRPCFFSQPNGVRPHTRLSRCGSPWSASLQRTTTNAQIERSSHGRNDGIYSRLIDRRSNKSQSWRLI